MSVANGEFTRTNSFGSGEARAYPRFYIEPVEDPLASAQNGRMICRDEERVEIILPGNPLTKPVHVVTDVHRQRWAQEYKAFKEGMQMSVEGTPLEQWPILKRSQIMELKALGFLTVEQMACADDHAIARIGMGGRRLKEYAIAFLDDAAAGALASKLAADNDAKTAEITSLTRQVAELGELVRSMHSNMQARADAPNVIQSTIPGMIDPIAQAAQMAQQHPVSGSSLDSLPAPKRGPGRPKSPVAA